MQKVDTGKVYAMKSLQKAEMLQRDQVRSSFVIISQRSSHTICATAGPCSCRTGRLGRVNVTMGSAAFLLLPRSTLSLSYHGISTRGRPYDDADEVRYLLGGCHSFLHGRMCPGYRSCAQPWIHPPVSSLIPTLFCITE